MTTGAWFVVSLAYSGLEYWLGKTDKVAPGSVIEAVIWAVKEFMREKDYK